MKKYINYFPEYYYTLAVKGRYLLLVYYRIYQLYHHHIDVVHSNFCDVILCLQYTLLPIVVQYYSPIVIYCNK